MSITLTDPRLNDNAIKILELLETEGPMSQKKIAQRVGIASRSTRTALKRLVEIGAVAKRPNLEDMRTSMYFLVGYNNDDDDEL